MKEKIKTVLEKNNIKTEKDLINRIEYLKSVKSRGLSQTQELFDLVGALCNDRSDLLNYFHSLTLKEPLETESSAGYWDATATYMHSPKFIDYELQKKMQREDLKKAMESINNSEPKELYEGCIIEGIKDTDGKADYSEINLDILELMAKRFTANKHKYPKGNSLKVIDKDVLLWAAIRHLKKMLKPEDNDLESYQDHLAAILCNMSMVLDQLEIKNGNI